ncbi:hypothetical protein [Pseudoduganella aquatica]|uniref:Uncharacterized protein n=1 Tax=Pseudoduganella aquatica TaxID=2660641 RepID=A0A7X4HIE6_9BURK|nr:hypothetical protein [Pseudoduganella aquatica]MYN11348.1 hypothetical protein [Pseudoduganella aquatica]
MKKLLLAPLLFMVCIAAMGQTAQDPQMVDSVRVPATGLSIVVPEHRLGMYAVDFGAYKGAYDLSNGGLLQLTSQGRRMYAQLDNGERTEIVGTGMQSFVALDRSLQMSFERKPDGDMGGELLIARTPRVAGEPVQYLLVSLR